MWTQFWDMHSGGGQKLKWHHVFIEAPQKEAVIIFQNRFGRNPFRVTCTCCGEDYAVDEYETLEDATGFERGCGYGYFDKDGNEVTEKQARNEGGWIKKGYKQRHAERPDTGKYSHRKYIYLEDYKKHDDILIIYEKDIKPEEKEGELHEEGYVWRD